MTKSNEIKKSISASSVARYENCSGSFLLEEKLNPEMRYNAFPALAGLGSQIHAASEIIIRDMSAGNKLKTPAVYMKAQGIDKSHADYEKALNCVTEYPKFFKKILTARNKNATGVTIAIETKYEKISSVGIRGVFKADALIVSQNKTGGKTVDLFDLKTGNYDYSESAKSQMVFSAQILLLNSPLAATENVIINTHVVQPTYWESARTVVSDTFMMTKTDASGGFDMLVDTLLTQENCFTPGGHCIMCPAIATCPAQIQLASVMQAFLMVHAGNVETVTPDVLEYFWLNKKSFETFLTAIEQRVLYLMENGHYFEKLFKKLTYGHRRWVDVDMVKKQLAFLGDNLFKPAELKTPAQVEKLAGKENITDLYTKPEIYKVAAKETADADIFGGEV